MSVADGTEFAYSLDDMLTEHFRVREFFWHKGLKRETWARHPKLRKVQVYLAYNLALKGEAIRQEAKVPIHINSGCRDKFVYKLLFKRWVKAMKEGRKVAKPSRTSDHFFMNDIWPLGVGAMDFTPVGFDTKQLKELFDWIVLTWAPDEYGQVIFYPEQVFIHLSNPYEMLGDVGIEINKPLCNKILIYSYKEKRYKPYRKI